MPCEDQTRKPNWRKCKRTTAVRVRRPSAKMCMQYSKLTICDFY